VRILSSAEERRGSGRRIEDRLKEIEIDKQIVEKPSILVMVRKRELELRSDYLESQKKAEQIIAEARKKSSVLKEQAERDGLEEGKVVFKTEVDRAKEEAKKIRESVQQELSEIDKKGKENSKEAVKKIIEAILP
jgi:vacuolar-type H+-ATPase subunit H